MPTLTPTSQYIIPAGSPALFTEQLKQSYTGIERFVFYAALATAWAYRNANPEAPVNKVTAAGTTVQADLTQRVTGFPNDVAAAKTATDLALGLGVSPVLGKLLGSFPANVGNGAGVTSLRELLYGKLEAAARVKSNANAAELVGEMNVLGEDLLELMVEEAMRDAILNEAFTDMLKPGVQGWPKDGDPDISRRALGDFPDFHVPQPVRDGLQPDGSVVVTVASIDDSLDAALLAAAQAGVESAERSGALDLSLEALPPGATLGLDPLSVDRNLVLDVLGSSARNAISNAHASGNLLRTQSLSVLEVAGQEISVLGKLIGLADKRAGKAVDVVGSAVISVATAVLSAEKTVTDLASKVGMQLAQGLGAALLTGNVISAALSVVSLFSGPDPTQQMLSSIQSGLEQISKQVAALSEHLDARLDAVDDRLRRIYGTLLTGLTEIEVKLDNASFDLAVIRSELVDVQSKLNGLDSEMRDLLQALGQRDLVLEAEATLNWTHNHIDPTDTLDYDASDPSFVHAEATFATWATALASDPDEVSTATLPSGDLVTVASALADTLPGRPVPMMAGYVARALSALGIPSFGGVDGRLPNLTTWSIAADAYSQLQLEWPEYAKRFSADHLLSITGTGGELLRTLITLQEVEHRSDALPVSPALDGLRRQIVEAADGAATGLAGRAQPAHGRVAGDEAGRPKRVFPANVFGPPDQPAGAWAVPVRGSTAIGSSYRQA